MTTLHHIAIQAKDYERSIHFYKEVLGLKEVASVKFPVRDGLFLDLGNGSLIELFAPKHDGSTKIIDHNQEELPVWHFALAVDDVETAIERCREAGYPIKVEPKTVKSGRRLSCDPCFRLGPKWGRN